MRAHMAARDVVARAIHHLNGLYDARLDHAPLVAIVGQTATTAMYELLVEIEAAAVAADGQESQ
jgi:pyruvate dehydrogenase (quinone)